MPISDPYRSIGGIGADGDQDTSPAYLCIKVNKEIYKVINPTWHYLFI